MAQLAILAAIQVGLAVTSYFLTPKPQQQPLDKGRLDDLRFQTAEEGGTRPKCYGLDVRLAGNIIDATRTKEFKTTSPGRSGGKGGGGGRGGEPPTTNFTYKKTFAIEFCEGPILSFLEIKEDDEVVYNLAPAEVGSSYYQAEASGNTLAGGAVIVTDTTLVSRRKVNLPPAASVQWNTIPIDVAGTVEMVIYYQSTVSAAATVRINSTDYPITLPSTSGALGYFTVGVTMPGGNNTVKITNNHGSATISVDQIFAFRDIVDDTTGVVHPTLGYPGDLNNPRPFYDYAPYRNQRGEVTGIFANGGQAPFELYLGTEDQLQSPTLVALHGAASTPAYRGIAYFVANQYTLKEGRLGNFTARVQPAISDLADALTDMYLDRGADPAELNFTSLAGITIDRGFVINRRSPLSDYLDPLQLWYNFDLVPTGGTIKAVRRGGASFITIPESKLAAHEEGSEHPAGSLVVDHVEETDLPGSVDVLYVDAAESKEFHTATQHVERQVGNSLDPETLTFPIISDKNTAHAVGKRWLYEQVLKAKPLELATGPEFRYLIPTDIITLPLATATYVARITSRQASFGGLVKFKAVLEKAAIYTQVGVGQIGSGTEIPPVAFPPNTFLALLDIPPLRLEDDQLGFYAAVCPRGTGNWRGAHLYKELITGTYDRLTGFDRAATMGVISTTVSPFTGDTSVIDRASTITFDLFFDDGLIVSHTEDELLRFPINVLVIGSGASAEILQFATATPQAAVAPYVSRYQLSILLRGRIGTENGAIGGHAAGKSVVFLSDELKFRNEDPLELRGPRNYKAVSVGQALVDAPVTSFTLEGFSQKPLAPVNLTGARDSAGSLSIAWTRRSRIGRGMMPYSDVPLGEDLEQYDVEILTMSNLLKRTMRVVPGGGQAAMLIPLRNPSLTSTNNLLAPADGAAESAPLAYTLQQLRGSGAWIEFTLVASQTNSQPSAILMAPEVASGAFGYRILADLQTETQTIVFQHPSYVDIFAPFAPLPGIRIFEGSFQVAALKYSSGSLGSVTRVRIRIAIFGTELRYYWDWTGPGSIPFYISQRPVQLPLVGAFQTFNPGAEVRSINVGTTSEGPSTIYSADQQVSDFGSTQNPVRTRVYQVSSLVGRGNYLQGDI